jgi:DNA-binding beta-propeller fold protein YncE
LLFIKGEIWMKKLIKIILSLLIILFWLISCKSETPAPDYKVQIDQESVQGLIYGDSTGGPSSISTIASRKISGMDGYFNIKGISGIKAFQAWGSYKAVAFLEKDRHTAWMFYQVGSSWYTMKLGGTPDIANDAVMGYSSWFNTPMDIEKMGSLNTTDSSGGVCHNSNYSSDYLYFTDSLNGKVKLVIAYLYTSGACAGYKLAVPVEYADFGISQNPVGITKDGDSLASNLFVSTKQGKIYKIAPGGVLSEIYSVVLDPDEWLHGITYDTDNSRLFYIKGNRLFKINTDGSGNQEVILNASTTKDIFTGSDKKAYKDIEYFNGKLYITNPATHTVFQVDPATGVITIFAGKDTDANDMLGDRISGARFRSPFSLSVNKADNTLYISDYANNNIKTIAEMNAAPTTVSKMAVDTDAPKSLFEPRGIAVSPGGKYVYIADSSNYQVKRVVLETGQTETVPGIGEYMWAVWDVEVVREKNDYETRDRYLYVLETNKSTFAGRVKVHDLIKGTTTLLYGPIPNLGKFMGGLTLNSSATKIWVTSREQTVGKIYLMPVRYDTDTGDVSIPENYDMTKPPEFLSKDGYFPLSIAYYRDPQNYGEYLFVTAVTSSGDVTSADMAKVSRFQISEARSGIEPTVVSVDYDFWGPKSLYFGTIPVSYPRSITSVGKYILFTDNYAGTVTILDGTGSPGQNPAPIAVSYSGSPFMPFGIAVDSVKKKAYLSSDSGNSVFEFSVE